MEEEDDGEDTHVCLRCQTTIIGLSNYITHRKAGCGSRKRSKLSAATVESTSSFVETLQEDIPLQRPNDQQKEYPRADRSLTVSASVTKSPFAGQHEDSSNLQPSSDNMQACYDASNERHRIESLHKGQSSTTMHSYSVLESYASPVPQVPKDTVISSEHSQVKSKVQETHTLARRQNPSQAPFTGYGDPLLPHSQEGVALLRPFDGFGVHQKIQHEGDTDHHSEPMPLFKPSYELDSQSFESRYSEFYSIQSTPQEPILNTESSVDNCKSKDQEECRMAEQSHNQGDKQRSNTSNEQINEDASNSQREFNEPDIKYESHMSPDHSAEKSDLRQDDFLSSLELRSSIKLHAKRQHEDDEDEDDEDEDDDENRPPKHHTGGKWRPGSQPPPSVGGKWRPATPKNELEDEVEELDEEEHAFAPLPPTYTKGKWLPGKRISNIVKVGSSIEYHCSSCNRTLKGKDNYERHLNSELHSVNENKISGMKISKLLVLKTEQTSVESTRPVRSKKLKAQSFLRSTIARLKSRSVILDEAGSNQNCKELGEVDLSKKDEASSKNIALIETSRQDLEDEEENVKKVSAASRKLLCPVCKLSFGEPYLSLHLASLAHIHNELEYRQNRSAEVDLTYRKLVLKNFSAIVKSLPFCCHDCSFYCNTNEDILNHVKSHKEDEDLDEVKTVYSCSSCSDDDSLNLSDLIHHIQTPYHSENSLDQILQAKQVVIKSAILIVCPFGDGNFRYRREYLTHRRTHHGEASFQLSDQRLLYCPLCNSPFLRERDVRIHIREVHKPSKSDLSYHCFVCGLTFPTQQQAKSHRRSAEHRTTLGRQRGISVVRTCNLCYVETEDLSALRQHMVKEHQKDCTPCHLCGVVLPHRSDLAQHQRICSREPENLTGIHSCELCNFKNDLLAHVLMHFTLAHSQHEADERYPCHICKTKLRNSSIKGHMLGHSNEWPYACHLCSRKFPHGLWLERHLAIVHTHSSKEPRDTKSLCDLCGKTLSNRCHLHRHKQEVKCHAPLVSLEADDSVDNLSRGDEHSSKFIYISSQSHQTDPSSKDTNGLGPHQGTVEFASPGTSSYVPVTYSSVISGSGVLSLTTYAGRKESQCPRTQRDLKRSKLSHHSHIRRHIVQQCEVCGVQCESISALKGHRQEHKRRGGSHYQCPHCSYNTTHLPHLRRHLRLHTGSTPFCCPYCTYVCNNQENLRKHMLKTKRHPGRYMYECRLCMAPEPSQNTIMPSGDQIPSAEPIDYSGPQSLDLESGNPGEELELPERKDEGAGPASERQCSSSDQSLVFKTNYAIQLQIHLTEKHPKCFQTKEEITNHIRSYYRPDQDATVTTSPLPFTHKKRQKRVSPMQGMVKVEDVDDPAAVVSTSTTNTNGVEAAVAEDVLSQIKQTFDIQEYREKATIGEAAAASTATSLEAPDQVALERHKAEGKELETPSEIRHEAFQPSGMDGHPIQADEVAVSKDLSAVAGTSYGNDLKVSRGPRSYLRSASRPSILKSILTQPTQQPQPTQQQPLRILIQHLPDATSQEGEDEGTRQVILILPENFRGQPGDVAPLLPSLGLVTSPADCVSIVTVQPKDDQSQQQLRILSGDHQESLTPVSTSSEHIAKHLDHHQAESSMIMPSNQVMTLDTQMVAGAEVIASGMESNIHQNQQQQHHSHQGSVVLCPQPQEQEQVFNPLQVVAEAAEVLTQGELVTSQVIEAQHPRSEVLSAQQTQLLQEAMFNHHPNVSIQTSSEGAQSTEAAGILQQEASVEYVDVVSSDQVTSQTGEGEGEIIYSFSLT